MLLQKEMANVTCSPHLKKLKIYNVIIKRKCYPLPAFGGKGCGAHWWVEDWTKGGATVASTAKKIFFAFNVGCPAIQLIPSTQVLITFKRVPMYPINAKLYLNFEVLLYLVHDTYVPWNLLPGLWGGWVIPGLWGGTHRLLRRNVSGGTFSAGVHYRPEWF